MSTGLKANSDGSAAIQVGGSDAITLTSGGAAAFLTSPTTVQAGTVSAPSITFSGDTNTGIYSPGADTVGLTAGGTLVGSVGLGTTLALQGATSQSGTGITFPATQSASSNANTLDDYEEGTWTPTLNRLSGSSNYTFTQQSGFYTKIGNVVHVQFAIVISAITTQGTRFLFIDGLPFTPRNNTNQYGGGSVTTQSCISGAPCTSIGVNPNVTQIFLYGTGNPTVNAGLLGETGAAAVTVIAGALFGSITYEV